MKNKRRKKILISIFGFFPGGAEILPLRLANALHEKGYSVGVHCTKPSDDKSIRNRLNPEIPVYTTDRFWHMAWVLLFHGYNIVNSHCTPSQQLMARVKRRIPFLHFRHVATSHGGYEGMQEQEALTLLRNVDEAVDAWTYVADNNLPLFHKAGIEDGKLHKIGNAMEPPEKICPVSMEQYDIPNDAYVFSVITRAVAKKGWPACIAAVREARRITGKDIHLLLGGCGEVYDELKKKPIDEFVHMVGEIKRPCDVYAASYCGLLLSVLECAPLGIIEMYYAGIPVVATDTGDIKEMLHFGDNKTGILVPLTENGQVSIQEAGQAIAQMIQDKSLYESCKATAARKAPTYRMDAVAEQYISVYDDPTAK